MLKKPFVVCVFLFVGVHCNIFSNIDLIQRPYADSWSWAQPRSVNDGDVEVFDVEDREPLDPNYNGPKGSPSDQKPVLVPKSHNTGTAFNPVLPGGVVDVDATGFDTVPKIDIFSSLPEPDFDLSSFHLQSRPTLFSFGGFFGAHAPQHWWKGPNVCVERNETTDDDEDDDENDDDDTDKSKNKKNNTEPLDFFSTSLRLSNCQETAHKYECVTKVNNRGVVKTFTVTYKCCYGFKRNDGGFGCAKEVQLKPILETLDDLNLKQFRNMIKDADLEETFKQENITLFAPTDAALDDYNEAMSEMNAVPLSVRRRRQTKNPLSGKDLTLSHAVAGFIDFTDLTNEEVIYSENNNGSLRFNIYPTLTYNNRLITVNCARVKKSNNLAKNGIVHMMDQVIQPATNTIREIIEMHPKLTNLKEALKNSDVYSHMKESGHYTFFAPTDDAFGKLDEVEKQKIITGQGCAGSIVKHHITSHTVCSSAIIGNATTHNVEHNTLNFERTVDDALIFEGKANIIETDIVAKDGVIHLIDTIIVPKSAYYLGAAIKNKNSTKFQEIIEKAGLTDEINNLNNATVFVPSNRAFEKPEAKKLLEQIGDDKEKLQAFVRYHTVEGKIQSCDLNNNEKLTTNDNGNELRVNLYSMLPLFTNIVNRATVNCAKINTFDVKACGSVIHEVNKVLQPPTNSIYELIQNDGKYSTLLKMLEGTEVEEILKDSNRSITFLAPTDETFAAIDDDIKQKLLDDKDTANNVLKNHILTEILCCAGVGTHTWGFNNVIPTLADQQVEVGRVGSKIRINRAVVTSCDNLATNGVLHTINKVLVPQRPIQSSFGAGLFVFDL